LLSTRISLVSVCSVIVALLALVPASDGARSSRPRNGEVVFVEAGASSLFLVGPSGGRRRSIVRRKVSFPSSPAFSENGRLIAFAGYAPTGGRERIWTVRSNGKGLRSLTEGTDPAWSANGRRIAFARAHDIWVLTASDRKARRLTRAGAGVSYSAPSWSPDGKRLVAAVTRPDPSGLGDSQSFVTVLDVSSGSERQLTTSGLDYQPAWSPSGGSIVFHSHRNTEHGLYLVASDGTGEHALGGSTIEDHEPAWSPDGRKIVFARYASAGAASKLFVVNADGSGRRTIVAAGDPISPSWGPRLKRARR
jgi:TolB protein